MNYPHLTHIPGFVALMTELQDEQALNVSSISPVRAMAYEGAEELFFSLVDEVKDAVMTHTHRLAVSMGKDSTLMLAVFVEAHRQLIQEGKQPHGPLLVTHADTRIESPVMSAYAHRQIALLKKYLVQCHIPHEIYTAQPADRYSWPVMYIGGLKLLTVGASATADCSIELKQRPLQSVESQLVKKYGKNIVTVTGVRMDESAERKQTIIELGLHTGKVIRSEKNGAVSWDYAPLANISTDEIWLMLRCLGEGANRDYGNYLPYWSFSTWFLSKLYADQTESCPIVGSGVMSNARSGGCSSSLRSGCSLCTTVNIDKQAEVLSDLAQYPQLKNLLAIRNWLSHSFFDLQYRRFIGRKPNADGYVKLEANTFNEVWMLKVLRWVLQADADEVQRADEFQSQLQTYAWLQDPGIQAILSESITGWQKAEWIAQYIEDMQEPTFQLVTPSQLLLIDALWSRDNYQLPAFSALAVWDEVYHQQIRVDYPVITGKKAVNTIPAPRYIFVGNDPEFQSLLDIENSYVFSRYLAGLDVMEFMPEKCGTVTKPKMITTDVVTYQGEAGKTFEGWFGEYIRVPAINPKLDSDNSGYVIDEEAAYAITSFMIDDYLKVYHQNKLSQAQGIEYRANVAMRRLISEGVLRLSPMAMKNTARLMARAKLYEESGLLFVAQCDDDNVLSRTISTDEYKLICADVIDNKKQAEPSVLQQLNDIKLAAKSARELYKRLCASRCRAMITVNEMGKNFVFDGCNYYSLVATQTKQMQEISSTLSSVAGVVSLLPKSAPLRQHANLPMNVAQILTDFVTKIHAEFLSAEKECWQDALTQINKDLIAANDQFSVMFLNGGMTFIKQRVNAINYVKQQVNIRCFKVAS